LRDALASLEPEGFTFSEVGTPDLGLERWERSFWVDRRRGEGPLRWHDSFTVDLEPANSTPPDPSDWLLTVQQSDRQSPFGHLRDFPFGLEKLWEVIERALRSRSDIHLLGDALV